jgi:aminopeptidase-like protein
MILGTEMHSWATDLFPMNRSLTGDGVRNTLAYLQKILPEMEINSAPTGTKAFDWTIPSEWNLTEAWIADEDDVRIIDTADTNLHVVGYSEPVDTWMTVAELDRHLHSLVELPEAIPYVTSYYERRWGFCISHRQRERLLRDPDRRVHVVIDSTLDAGELIWGELVLPGSTDREVLLSTYVCHPSMANNELSGPCVQAAVARWLRDELPDRRLTYRILFTVETIGPLVYLSRHLDHLREKVIAGFVLTCLGDDRTYSWVASRKGNTLADRVARHILRQDQPDHTEYSFLERGSDERQYCSPGVNLPVCTLMRSKFGTYPEYHTSLDDLDLISPEGLAGGFQIVTECIRLLEAVGPYQVTTIGEPHLGARGLYPTLSTTETHRVVRTMMNLIAYSDGVNDLIAVADLLDLDARDLIGTVDELVDAGVLRRSSSPAADQ